MVIFEAMKLLKHSFFFLLVAFAPMIQSCGEEEVVVAPVVEEEVDDGELMVTDPDGKVFPWLHQGNIEAFLEEYGQANPETMVLITTEFGDIKLRLYEETPLHRANFVMMVKRGYYNHTWFYRVVNDFLIQGGNTDLETTSTHRERIGKYRIPAEFNEQFFHKRGALAMARDYEGNDARWSDPYNFYICLGEGLTTTYLNAIEDEGQFRYEPSIRATYERIGGTPHLDGEHTVFGELVDGLETVRKISKQKTDVSEWPEMNIELKAEIIE